MQSEGNSCYEDLSATPESAAFGLAYPPTRRLALKISYLGSEISYSFSKISYLGSKTPHSALKISYLGSKISYFVAKNPCSG